MANFEFKLFRVDDAGCGMKVSSDSVLLGAWFLPQVAKATTVVDAGAGSGLLSLMAAQLCPAAHICGVETDAGAVAAAKANFSASPWTGRLRVLEDDFLCADFEGIDAVVSNPPYFTDGAVSADAARAAARHCRTLGFDSLIERSAQILRPGGSLGFISPAECAQSIVFGAEMCGLKVERLCRVVTAPGKAPRRLLWHLRRGACSFGESVLALRNPDGSPSEQYRALVEPFYIRIN